MSEFRQLANQVWRVLGPFAGIALAVGVISVPIGFWLLGVTLINWCFGTCGAIFDKPCY